jgi:hypothetical protein
MLYFNLQIYLTRQQQQGVSREYLGAQLNYTKQQQSLLVLMRLTFLSSLLLESTSLLADRIELISVKANTSVYDSI